MSLFPFMEILGSAAPGGAVGRRQLLLKLRMLAALSIVHLVGAALIVAIFPQNLLADREAGDPQPALMTSVMGFVILSLLALAIVVERVVLRSTAPRVAGFPLPVDPLARYRVAKVYGIGLRDFAGALGFILGVMVSDLYGYAAILLAAVALAFAWPRAKDLPAEEMPAADSLAPG